jgi:hypothetical protein
MGEDILQRIVLPDDARQFRKRIRGLAGLGRLGRTAKLTLEIFEVEGETVSSWLTHGMIHSSAGRGDEWNAEPHARSN